ncbi:MAG TPA: RagB/SusD family nutrient uptake outer membrane protein [Lacibacter sp.]|nr:RagB/SusD family nutrient uptake outer membrane protein [Lacibacter sp.]HMO89331.1 RagB/SusD family nutrient uptake outer membrane protein [Lacibacter sp.]HMP85794.1 RagB/SusD family nutrient uptake outer membrane protein [Lacibacter sp.]
MKKIALYILLAAGLSSCKKFLSQEPYNRISVEDIFKDFEGARTVLVGCYDAFKSINYYMRDFYVFPEVTGGNIRYARSTSLVLQQSYQFENSPANNDLSDFFKVGYNLLYRCNTIIENVERVQDADTFKTNRMLADAYLMRALVHFDLVRVFAQAPGFSNGANHPGIIIRPQNTAIIEPQGTPVAVNAVYELIFRDCERAIPLYNNSVDIYNAGNARTYLSADAARALLVRAHLYNKNWTEVISYANQLITGNRYPLLFNSGYVNAWRGKNVLSESVFELAYGIRTGGSLGDFYNPLRDAGYLAATTDLLNLFAPGDVRGQSTMFVPAVKEGTTRYFTRKYQGANDSANNIRLFRISEVYLSRAEAYAENGNLTAALQDLNLIRRRANPSVTDFTSTEAADVLREILAERRRELCFEGHLFFDLSRRGNSVVRQDCTGTFCQLNYPNERFAVPFPVF